MLQLCKLSYWVTAVRDRQAVVASIAEGDYAAGLMDCEMPGLDSTTLTSDGCRLPITARTANATAGDREASFATGVNDYLAKPVKLDALRRVMARWIGPSAGE